MQALKRLLKPSKPLPKTFESFEEAAIACNESYENKDIVEVVKLKTLAYQKKLKTLPVVEMGFIPLLFALQKASRNNLNLKVLDFGGACGLHYFIAQTFLPDLDLDWYVVETPSMVEIAQTFASNRLNFSSSIEEAKNRQQQADLVIASGSLQFTPDPYQALRSLIDCQPKAIFITRTALTQDKEFATIQRTKLSENGPGLLPEGISDRWIEYPVFFAQQKKFEEVLQANYKIELRLDEGLSPYPFYDLPVFAYGYYCDDQ